MNKNLLLIAAAVGAYAVLRPKTTKTVTTAVPSANLQTGGNAYVQTAPAATTSASSGGNWLSAATGLISQGTSLVTQGVSAFDQIKGAFSSSGSATSGTTANVWAGPSTNYDEA